MNADRITTHQMLFDSVQYQMPLFQRPQSWSAKDRTTLWNDLKSVYEHWTDGDQASLRRTHFLGATVVQHVSSQPGEFKYVVIDGQQRLTNLWVILAVIRDQARDRLEDWDTLDEEIHQLYITNRFGPTERRQKLLLGALDQTHLEKISNREVPDQRSTVGKIYGDYRRKLRQAVRDYDPLDLNAFKDCVVHGISIVNIVMEPHENPHHIFESLNAKGRSLTNGDLVRNYLLMQIHPTEQQELYNRFWLPMEKAVVRNDKENDDSLTQFFARYLTIVSGDRVIEKHVYDTMKEQDKLGKEQGATTQELIRDLHRHHQYFCQMRKIENHTDQEISDHLQYLADWKIDLADPLVMKLLQLNNDAKITKNDLVNALRMLETLIVRRFISGMPPRELAGPLAKMASDPKHTTFATWFKQSISIPSLYPTDETLSEKFVAYRSSNSKRQRTRLILVGLEKSFRNNESPETKDVQLEHIMPETLNDEWREELGNEYQNVYDDLLEAFGNLSITKSNQVLSNKPFAEKKEILEASNFELNKKVVDYEKWNKDSILNRQAVLLDIAKKTWTI